MIGGPRLGTDRRVAAAAGRRPVRAPAPRRFVGATAHAGPRFRRPTRAQVIAWLAAVAIVAGLLGWVLYGSPWLRVAGINVVGGDGGQQARVRQIAQHEVGQPLVQIDSSAVQREVGAVPDFAHVDVIRDWPDRLTISVTVRTPVMAVQKSQGVVQLADADGFVYARVDAAPQGVPTVRLARPDAESDVRAAAGVMAALDPGQRARVTDAQVASADDVRFTIDGVSVIWGGPTQGRQKAVIMATLLQQKGVRTINVSAPDSPVMS